MGLIKRLLCALGWHGQKKSAGIGKLVHCERCSTVLMR